ncbi:hypothetical protein [Caldimonas aquatica]|uniref:Uncharacterized protein n=1 Tax=Caldimonas aquatica TaxID=376175 RepID=A0ABY6MSK2_9BURK|nr:hypothetical protein [Schlegelella aquatica]UZD54991.1 hypothetical protein OMP39_15210 [Schlegelella aquatica]
MSEPILLPYDVPRNLDQDAWFLYEATSIPYYELCAQLCEEFAHFFNKLIGGHQAHGRGRVDYWVSRYLTHAENIRRGIEFVRTAGDYMPMLDFLSSASSDYRGLIENAFGYETRDEWRKEFERMSYACGTGADVLRDNEWKGLKWLNRDSLIEQSRRLLDMSNGPVGDDPVGKKSFVDKYRLANPPASFPVHPIDRGIQARPGERCPRTGVWVPAQWADEGAGNFSLAFCIEGRAMQPAYRITGREVVDIWEDYDRQLGIEHEPDDLTEVTGTLKTVAVDTTWYFVHKPDVRGGEQPNWQSPVRLRCEANKPCPREGWWFTPAKADSRRFFRQGEVMPAFGTDYGLTIWQWDERQDT